MMNLICMAGDTGGSGGIVPLPPPPPFCVAKRKKENKGKLDGLSKQKALKGYH